ncbi:hypothetical protein PENSPDRAFT_672845 [Peniophora sp. CONT]|nr:hypothetical protein PENSPDRAFT_672845 [Peniophora sp. CONT]
MLFSITVSLALLIPVYAAPPRFSLYRRLDAAALHQNGLDAQAQNKNFTSLTADSTCTEGTNACVNNAFAQCVGGKFVLQPCSGDEICAALPLVNSAGTSITCTTTSDRDSRIKSALGSDSSDSSSSGTTAAGSSSTATATAGATKASSTSTSTTSGSGASGDLQTSLTLDQSLVGSNLAKDGSTKAGGETPSLTSTNNFINFCSNVSSPITNGQQVKTGSCNPVPMGQIAANTNMPQCKFEKPVNMGTVPANQNFTIVMAIKNLETGSFTNPETNYYSAPQQLADSGNIRGHSHFVIEALDSINQTTPLDNTKFAFFAGVNSPAKNGKLSVTVGGGLPKGAYRLASINSASNHQPVLVAEAQRGAVDDMIYFTAV